MAEIKIREILTKKPFKRISGFYNDGRIIDENITQKEFLYEYYPNGHKINDPTYYPNKIKTDPESGRVYEEKVIRCSFPHQHIISTKQIIHLCGNDIKMELLEDDLDKKKKEYYTKLRQGFQLKHSDYFFYKFVKSIKITGDGAIVGIIKDNKFYWKDLSFLNGDKLFAHYDELNKLKIFAREYVGYDDNGNENKVFVEVWDNSHHYLFEKATKGTKGKVIRILEQFGLEGYTEKFKKKHGFDFCPIVYYRAEHGACWSFSQDSCDKYELAVSHLCQNNMAYAFPIMFLKGEDVSIEGTNDIYAPVKSITGDSSSEAKYLETPNGSASFELQLRILLQNIYQGSFTVLPPEIKSGDLPGVAVKLLYSPAIEKAIQDAFELDICIQQMIDIFAHGYGLEVGEMINMKNLNISSWIEPYIHQNVAELMNNLLAGVQNGFLSKETAAQTTPYGKPDEFYKIMKEKKDEMDSFLDDDISLKDIENTDINTDINTNYNEA